MRQTKYIVMVTKEGSSKISDFMTPGAWFLGASASSSTFRTLIDTVLRDYNAAFLCYCFF